LGLIVIARQSALGVDVKLCAKTGGMCEIKGQYSDYAGFAFSKAWSKLGQHGTDNGRSKRTSVIYKVLIL